MHACAVRLIYSTGNGSGVTIARRRAILLLFAKICDGGGGRRSAEGTIIARRHSSYSLKLLDLGDTVVKRAGSGTRYDDMTERLS